MLIDVIEPHEAPTVWPHVRRHIQAAQRRGPTDHEESELRHNCCCRPDWRLLVLHEGEGAAVIRILNDRLHVVSLGGHLPRNWAEEFNRWLVQTAAYLELQGITLAGRPGWKRKLAPLGYVPIGGAWLERRL